MKITRKDVAREANVSSSTVSFILNGKTKYFNADTVKLVQETAKRLGYEPNRIAKALKTGKTNIIVLWMSNITSLYGTTIIKYIQKELLKYNYDLLIKEVSNLKNVSSEYADGIISYDCSKYLNKYIELNGNNIPIVLTGITKSDIIDNVSFDFSCGFKEAFDTIKIYKNIGYLTWAQDEKEERYLLYSNYIKNNNLKEYIIRYKFNNDELCDYNEILNQITHCDFMDKLDVIYCFDDYSGILLIKALHKLNLNHIKVIGTDNSYLCNYVEPSLSSIAIPLKTMCKYAVEFLINRINNKKIPIQKTLIDSHFVSRESSK